MELIIISIVFLLPITICVTKAKTKGLNPWGWLVVSLFLGWLAVIVILLLDTTPEKKLKDAKEALELQKQAEAAVNA